MRIRVVASLIAVAFTAGCAAPPQMTRSEYLAATSRTVPVPKEKVIAAAEKVLVLADGDDFTFQHNAAGFNAQRRWSMFLLITAAFGTDFWSVRTQDTAGGTKIELEVGTSSQAIAPMVTPGVGGGTATTLPASALPTRGPATYELFFERVNYLLGLRNDWPTCDWSKDRIKKNLTWGLLDPLCDPITVTDSAPTEPLKR